MDHSQEETSTTTEQELANAISRLKPFAIKKSWVSVPKKESEIGVGGFGAVHRGVLQKHPFAPRIAVAVKKLYTTGERDKRVRVALDLVRELTVHATLDHPNVLPLLGFHLSVELDQAWLISPYAPNGNIYDYLERVNPPVHERLKLANDTAKGLEYLHSREPPICHGDIKALNVLVSANMSAMLCDFGLSNNTEGIAATSNPNVGGTTRYWSPELFQEGNRPTLESDVWAWGCLLLEVVTSLVPYNDIALEGRVIHLITENILPAQVDTLDCPAHVRDLLTQCWRTPGERIKMSEVVGLLSAGNRHFLQQGSLPTSLHRSDTELSVLERELADFLQPLEKYRIKPSRLVFPQERSMIGSGGYGTVHQAFIRQKVWGNGDVIAVKKLKAAGGRDKCLRMAIGLIREMAVWARMSHENVIPLIGFYLSERLDQAWLISPYMENGNISDYLIKVQPSEQKRRELALDTAKGLRYLHELDPPICHGDIKALNVLITGEHRAMLCDFGLAKAMENMPSGLTTSTFNQGGTLPYESPELLLGKSMRSPESDVWAWGCLLQEIFIGKSPYYWAMNVGAIVKYIVQDIPPVLMDDLDCPIPIQTLLRYCWRRRPKLRPVMTQCVSVLTNPSMNADATNAELEALAGDHTPNRARVLRRSDLTFDEDSKIGSGCLGVVFKATLVTETTETDAIVAVKRLFKLKDPDTTERVLSMVRAKTDLWSTFEHPNVLPFTGYFWTEDEAALDILLVFPYMPNASIVNYIRDHSLNHAQRMKLATDAAEGLLYLHSRSPPIRHGNLHPWNILTDNQGNAILCDYDIDEVMGLVEEHLVPETFHYQSPEHLSKDTELTLRSDIWCLGSVFLQIIADQTAYSSFANKSALVEVLDQRVMPANVDELDCPPRVQNILGVCWKWEPESRPSVSEVISILSGKLCNFTEVWSLPVKGFNCFGFSNDGKFLVVGFSDAGIRVYDAETGILAYELSSPVSSYHSVQMSRSGRFLVASSRDHKVLIWDLEMQELKHVFEGHSNDIWALAMTPNDAHIISASYDNSIRAWCPSLKGDKGKVLHKTKERISCLAVSPIAEVMAISLSNLRNELLDTNTGDLIAILERPTNVWTLQFSPDGQRIYGGCSNGSICCWDVSDLVLIKEKKSVPYLEIKGGRAAVLCVSVSNSWIFSTSNDGDIRAAKLDSSASSTDSIGRIGRLINMNRSDVIPVSEDGAGLAVSYPEGSERMTVYRFKSWDIPGAYLG